jgi:hypothetical protein
MPPEVSAKSEDGRFYVRINAASAILGTVGNGRLKAAALTMAQRDGISPVDAASQVLDWAEAGQRLPQIERQCRSPR